MSVEIKVQPDQVQLIATAIQEDNCLNYKFVFGTLAGNG